MSLTAVPALLSQASGSAAEAAAAGCHAAFFGIMALALLTALGIAVFARDRKGADAAS